MNNLRQVLIFIFICLVPFQDTALQSTLLLGLGVSFAIIPLLILAAVDLCLLPFNACKKININHIYAILYILAVNCFGIAYFGLHAGSANTALEGIKLSVDTLLALYVIFGIDYSNQRNIGLAIHCAFFITLAGIAINDLNLLGLKPVLDNGVFHYTANTDLRWRGTTRESFWLGTLLVSLGLLSAHYSKSKLSKSFFWALTVLLTVLGASKGGFLCIFIVLFVILTVKRGGYLRLLLLIATIAPVFYVGITLFMSQISPRLLLVTESIPTRVTMAFWSIIVFIHFPFGVGFTGFLPAMEKYLPAAKDASIRLFGTPNANFSEINLTIDDVNGASTKSMLATFTAFYGFPFLAFIAIACSRIIKFLFRYKEISLLAAVLFVILSLSTYDDVIFAYQTFIVLGVAAHEYITWNERKIHVHHGI